MNVSGNQIVMAKTTEALTAVPVSPGLSDHSSSSFNPFDTAHSVPRTPLTDNDNEPKLSNAYSNGSNSSLSFPDTVSNSNSYSEERTLHAHGYKTERFITSTLQGKTFTALHLRGAMNSVVIKATQKHLHRQGITIKDDGKVFDIKEDIVTEAAIMRRFARHSAPSSIIKFIDFFEDSKSYFLVTFFIL